MRLHDVKNKWLRRLLSVLLFIGFFIAITISLIAITLENFFYALKYYLVELREDIKTYYTTPLKDVYKSMIEQFKGDNQ